MPDDYPVKADVFLLTDEKPNLMYGDAFTVDRSEQASSSLLDDLRADQGMSWVPQQMWLTYARVDGEAQDLSYDLAIGVDGHVPNAIDTGTPFRFTWLLGTQ